MDIKIIYFPNHSATLKYIPYKLQHKSVGMCFDFLEYYYNTYK